MKFNVTMTSDWEYKREMEFNTIDELMDFVKQNGRIIIFPPNEYNEGETIIEIYDDYRE